MSARSSRVTSLPEVRGGRKKHHPKWRGRSKLRAPQRNTVSFSVLPTDCYQKPFSCQIKRTLFIHCPAQPLSDIFYCGPALPFRRPFPWPLAPLLCELPSAPRTLFLGLHCLLLWIPSCLFLILYASWWEVRSSWTIIGMKRKRLNVEITWRGFQLTQVKPGGEEAAPELPAPKSAWKAPPQDPAALLNHRSWP